MTDFKQVERLFSEFFANNNSLSTDEQCEVQEFIDHGEYGLALDTLVGIFIEERKTPTDDLLSTVAALSECMSRDPNSLLDRLRQSK